MSSEEQYIDYLLIYLVESKKLFLVINYKKENYSQKLMKKLSNLVTTEEKNRLFYINKIFLAVNC